MIICWVLRQHLLPQKCPCLVSDRLHDLSAIARKETREAEEGGGGGEGATFAMMDAEWSGPSFGFEQSTL